MWFVRIQQILMCKNVCFINGLVRKNNVEVIINKNTGKRNGLKKNILFNLTKNHLRSI